MAQKRSAEVQKCRGAAMQKGRKVELERDEVE